jgi:hypothetical protein
MSQFVIGETIRRLWTVLDGNGAAVTGITAPADVTLTLHLNTGSGFAAASEAVTLPEIGVTGSYNVTVTPLTAGQYHLVLYELGGDAPLGRRMEWDFDVVTAGSVFVPSLSNAFCSESDIERWMQQSITSATAPSSTEAAGFAETRAAILMSICTRYGFEVTPVTVVSGSRLQDMLREANAIGAAWDCVMAASFSSRGGSLAGKAEWLQALWTSYVGGTGEFGQVGAGLIEQEIRGSLASLSTDHILSGDTTAPTVTTAPVSLGIVTSMSDLY